MSSLLLLRAGVLRRACCVSLSGGGGMMVGLAARCGPGRGARCLRLQVRSGRVSVRVYYVRLYVRMAFSETQTTLRTAPHKQQTLQHSSQSTFKFSGGTATHIPWPLSLSVLRLSRSTGTRCCEVDATPGPAPRAPAFASQTTAVMFGLVAMCSNVKRCFDFRNRYVWYIVQVR